MCLGPVLNARPEDRLMNPSELVRRGRIPFLLSFMLALIGMPQDVCDFHERQVGIAHSMPWLSRAGAMVKRVTDAMLRLLDFFAHPAVQRYALAAMVLAIALAVGHFYPTQTLFVAGMTLPELREQKGRLANEADQILQKAREEKRFDLSKEEDERFEKIHEEIERLSKQIEREEKQAATMASLESSGRRSEPLSQDNRENRGGDRVERKTDDPTLEGLRSWLMAGCVGHDVTPEVRAMAARHSVDLNSKHFTIRLPEVPLRANTADGIAQWRMANNITEKRAALGVGSGAIGGYTVKDEMMKSLEVSLLAYGGMRQAATVIRTETGADLPWPTVNDTANKGRRISENSGLTNTDVAFNQIVFNAFKYTSDYVLVAWEFLQDSTINAASVLGDLLGIRIARILNDELTTGTGSGQPNGIVTAAGSGVTSVADPPTYDNIIDLVHSVDPAYREQGAKFMLSDATLKTIKKIKVLQYSGDTTGVPLWQPSLTAGQPNRIHDYEYVINQSMASPGSSAKKMLFGALQKYMIRDVRDVTLVRLDERFAELGQVAFLAFSRHDGDLLDSGTDPVKYMQQS
jgi:HK97 family phage major capsid protein